MRPDHVPLTPEDRLREVARLLADGVLRKGKWSGGMPLLGYDVAPKGFRLLVNEDEAVRVRAIFELYLQHQSLLPVVRALAERGWLTKRWVTRAGHERGGRPFDRTNLYRLLTNVAYTGRVRYKDEVHPGEHPGIVDATIFERVQALLRHNAVAGGAPICNQFGALLKGLLRCVCCDSAMTPTHTPRGGSKRYRYYACIQAQKGGAATCPSRSIPAAQIEGFVVERIQCIGRDPSVLQETLAQARKQDEARLVELEAERRALEKDLARWHADMGRLTGQLGSGQDSGVVVTRLADLQERTGLAERRLAGVREQAQALRRSWVDEREVAAALAAFTPVWEALAPREQARVVQLLVERVDYDGAKGKVSITFHPTGIQTLADELAEHQKQEKIA